jgi:hypothetical protein
MFTLPKDCELAISEKYKDIPDHQIHSIIDDIFQEIVKKTTLDSSCTVRGLGKFICFKYFDKRRGIDALRFKFTPSYIFKNKLNADEHLLRRVPIKTPAIFKNTYLVTDEAALEQTRYNKNAEFKATTHSRKRTQEKLAEKVIMDILKDTSDITDPI